MADNNSFLLRQLTKLRDEIKMEQNGLENAENQSRHWFSVIDKYEKNLKHLECQLHKFENLFSKEEVTKNKQQWEAKK